MRVNFVDVLVNDSLRNVYRGGKIIGYAFDVRLSYYRGHYLSDIDCLEISVDGEEIHQQAITFCLNGKELTVSQIKEAYTEFWRLLDSATIEIYRLGGLPAGKHHVQLKLMLRVPYLPLPGGDDHSYMPLDSCGETIFMLEGGAAHV